MAKESPAISTDDEWRRSITFDFPKGKTPEGFDKLELDDEATITVTGKITRLSASQDGSSFTVTRGKVEDVQIEAGPDTDEGAGKPMQMGDALKQSRPKR